MNLTTPLEALPAWTETELLFFRSATMKNVVELLDTKMRSYGLSCYQAGERAGAAELAEAQETARQLYDALEVWEGGSCGGDCLANPCSRCDGTCRTAGKGERLQDEIDELRAELAGAADERARSEARERILRDMLVVTALRAYPDKSKNDIREEIEARLASRAAQPQAEGPRLVGFDPGALAILASPSGEAVSHLIGYVYSALAAAGADESVIDAFEREANKVQNIVDSAALAQPQAAPLSVQPCGCQLGTCESKGAPYVCRMSEEIKRGAL